MKNKNNYHKYINEVWKMKEKAYKYFLKSGFNNCSDFLKEEIKDFKVKYHKHKTYIK